MSAPGRLVWDLPVRLMHWSLAIAVAGSWATQELEGDWFLWHTRCGYAVLVLVLTRLAWGFVGTRHARFASFLASPMAAWQYARRWLAGDAPRPAGHNPLGAWMVVLLLALLLTQACLGLFANDQIINTGPLFGYVSVQLSDRLTTVHKQLFDWLLAAIALHVAAAFAYLAWKRDDLITPMFTGRKPDALVPEHEAIDSSRSWLALLLLAGFSAALTALVRAAPEASLSFF